MQDQNCPYKETRTTAVHATEVQHLRVNKGAADLSIVDVGVFKFQVQSLRSPAVPRNVTVGAGWTHRVRRLRLGGSNISTKNQGNTYRCVSIPRGILESYAVA